MNDFEFIPLNIDRTACSGIRIVKHSGVLILITWNDNTAVLYDCSKLKQNDSKLGVVSIKNQIREVFELRNNVCCLDAGGIFYKLLKPVDARLDTEDEDMFDPFEDFNESPQTEGYEFVNFFSLTNVISVCPLSQGLAAIKDSFGWLIIEQYNVSADLTEVDNVSSKQLCLKSFQIQGSSSCVMRSKQVNSLSRNLAAALIGTLGISQVEVIFIGLGNGQVYYIPSGNNSALPILLYSSIHPIAEISFLKGSTHDILMLVMKMGLLVEVDHSGEYRAPMKFITSCLPGSIITYCSIGEWLLASDGNRLWRWQAGNHKETSSRSTQEYGVLTFRVRGVLHLTALPENEEAIAVTVHGTVYRLFPKLLSKITLPGPGREVLHAQSVSLKNQLKLLEKTEQKILQENHLLAAIGLAMRSDVLKDSFEITVKVHDGSLKNAVEFQEQLHTSIQEIANTNKYILEIFIKTCSDKEFSTDVWDLHLTVHLAKSTIHKIVHLQESFKKGNDIKTALYVDLENPIHPVILSCELVCEMPSAHRIDQCGSPWLFVSIGAVKLDIGYYLTPSLTLSEDIQSNQILFNRELYQNTLPKIRENYTPTNENKTLRPRDEEEYSYTFSIPSSMTESNLWLLIFRKSWHRCSSDLHKWFQCGMERAKVSQSIWVRTGKERTRIVISPGETSIQLVSKDPEILHALKAFIRAELTAASKYPSTLTYNSSVLDIAQSLAMNLDLEATYPDAENLKRLRQEWRNSVTSQLFP